MWFGFFVGMLVIWSGLSFIVCEEEELVAILDGRFIFWWLGVTASFPHAESRVVVGGMVCMQKRNRRGGNGYHGNAD